LLLSQTLSQTEKGPAVVGQASEIVAIDLLGLREPACLDEDGA
jgi:hypothetical protein